MKKRPFGNPTKENEENLRFMVDTRLEQLSKIVEAILNIQYSEQSKIWNQIKGYDPEKEYNDHCESIIDDGLSFDEYFFNIRSYLCVLLHQNNEMILRNIVCVRERKLSEHDNYFKKSMKLKKIIKKYNKTHEKKITELIGFKECRIIQEINNAFKHNDNKVSKELEKVSDQIFNSGNKIKLSAKQIIEYLESQQEFCKALLNNKLKTQYTAITKKIKIKQ